VSAEGDAGRFATSLLAALAEPGAVVPLLATGADGHLHVVLLARHSVLARGSHIGLVCTKGETSDAILATGRAWILALHGQGSQLGELSLVGSACHGNDFFGGFAIGAVTTRAVHGVEMKGPRFVDLTSDLDVRERWQAQTEGLEAFVSGLSWR
jgi:hypothetical protein